MPGLRTCIYKVPDLLSARHWYAKVFQTSPYFDESFYIGFSIGGYELGLLPDEKSDMAASDNVMTYWASEEIDKDYQRFLQEGATEHEAPHSVGGEILVASVRDPWGNVIGLIYNPHFKVAPPP